MANIAVLDNGTIINVIIAHTVEIAQELTGKDCLLLEEGSPFGIGWLWSAEHATYLPPKPYPSWIWNGTIWTAPVELPFTDPLTFINPVWDEESLSWVEGPELETPEE